MNKIQKFGVAAALLLVVMTAYAAVINALDFDGGDSYGLVSDTGSHARTGGEDYVFGAIWNADTLTTGADGWATIMQFKRTANDLINHGFYIRDDTDAICYGYAIGNDICGCAGTLSINVDYLTAVNYDVATDTITLRNFTLDGTQVCSDTLTPTATFFSDSETQDISFGSVEAGGVFYGDLDGQIDLAFFLRGAEKSQSELAAYAIDPLATGDEWLGTHTSAVMKFWFDSTITCPGSVCTDVSGNSETLTLSGGATLGSGNGPDIPARVTSDAAAIMRRHRG